MISHRRIALHLEAVTAVFADYSPGMRPAVPGDEENSGFQCIRIQAMRDGVGFPHGVADGGPALMIKDHTLL